MFKNRIDKYLVICTIVCAIIAFLISQKNYKTTQELAQSAEIKLHEKEQLALDQITELTESLKNNQSKNLFEALQTDVSSLYKQEGIALYVYYHDSLCFWSDNQPAIDIQAYTNVISPELIKIRNGWFELITQKHGLPENYCIVALIAIKPEYDFQNKYLINQFSPWLNLPENTKLKPHTNFLGHTIKSKSGKPLFEIYRSAGLYRNITVMYIEFGFSVLTFILLFLFVFRILKQQIRNKIKFIFFFGMFLLLARTFMIYFKFPNILYDSIFYDNSLYANASSFYFGHIGDILCNSILIFIVTAYLYKLKVKVNIINPFQRYIIFFISFPIIIQFSFIIRNIIFSLVNNSTISYNINELFSFNWISLICLISIGFLLFSFYLLAEKLIIFVLREKQSEKIILFSFILITIVSAVLIHKNELNAIEYLWSLPFFIISYFLRKYKASYNYLNIGLIILTSTFIISSLFNAYSEINKKQTYDALAVTLTDRQDVIAEYEFLKISSSIKKDFELKNLFSLLPLSANQIEQRLRQINFNSYFERYDIVLALFTDDCTPVFKPTNPLYLNEDYFNYQIEKEGFQTICDELYFIDKYKKSIRYIAKINIDDINKNLEKKFRLYIQMEPRLANNSGKFPDILLDKSLENKLESKNISYAVYESNKLLATYGEYQYPVFINDKTFKNNQNDSFEHFVYSNNPGTTVIISDAQSGVWKRLTSNSYLFIVYSLLVLTVIFFNSNFIRKSAGFKTLQNRIQFIFVSVVLLSLAGVVIGTVWVVTTQFELKNKTELISKSQSVLKELLLTSGQQDILEPSYKEYTSYSLKKLSNLFASDIALYDKNGALYASSQPAIYEQGLISKFMNPIAYLNLTSNKQTNFTHKENIGTLPYLSAYIPFYNQKEKLIGFINLPYFSRQKDLERELTAYLTTLINIYTFLFVLTTLVALLVSNLLTKPLRIIKQQISNIKFGTHNASLKWKSKDEIGDLVNEYNNMLIKLERNSELLAKSERESAWREMAKQVAHEIKNPLTPMKLNIQHLQRIVKSSPEDLNEKVDHVTKILIEQIDTLSHIATEFSNFAQLTKTTIEVVNISEVLKHVADLFKQNTNCDITLTCPESVFIKADKKQCIRIFTNLLKNAEQSIPLDRKGDIRITSFEDNQSVIIKIKDNGCGIEDHIKQKLFTPNFTTKNTGMGLGLAMVKNAMLHFNGSIHFETEVNFGTTFTLSFPVLKESDLI